MSAVEEQDVHQQFAEYFPVDDLKRYFYLLSKRLSEGNICVPFQDFAAAELPIDYKVLATKEALLQQPLVTNSEGRQPIVVHNDNVYLHRYFSYETAILKKIQELISSENDFKESSTKLLAEKTFINSLFPLDVSDEPNWQFAAAIAACLEQFTIITGGPGTGKTTTIAKALAILYKLNPSANVALAAPTGKAANRMAESLKQAAGNFSKEIQSLFIDLKPSTIHRLLGVRKNSIHFNRNAEQPLAYDIIIVDETSMMDAALMSKFLEAVPATTKLIFLGDKNQLTSVEAGSVFGDLCESLQEQNIFTDSMTELLNQIATHGTVSFQTGTTGAEKNHPLFGHIVSLTKSYRFNDEAGIGAFSKAVLNNDVQIIESFFKNEDSQITILPEDSDKELEAFILKYNSYINEPDIKLALQLLNNQKILCATKLGKKGVHSMNRTAEVILQKHQLIQVTGAFYNNMPIMMAENNYQLELFNGDTGIVREKDGELRVWFENSKNELVSFIPAYISSANKCYAMTIHKSQGSEYKEVWVSLPEEDEEGHYSRELLYTAVTRAKKKAFIDSKKEMILAMAARQVKRSSGVVDRLKLND